MFEVYRVEDRNDPDAVDFWDFLTEDKAKQWIETKTNILGENLRLRPLSEQEIIDNAIEVYKDLLNDTEDLG